MKTTLCIVMIMLLSADAHESADHCGKIESIIRGHIKQCEADGLHIPIINVEPALFNKLVDEVGWGKVLGSHGHRRWIVFKTPDLTRKSGKRYFRVEQYPTPENSRSSGG